jgi:hypothetical protein
MVELGAKRAGREVRPLIECHSAANLRPETLLKPTLRLLEFLAAPRNVRVQRDPVRLGLELLLVADRLSPAVALRILVHHLAESLRDLAGLLHGTARTCPERLGRGESLAGRCRGFLHE